MKCKVDPLWLGNGNPNRRLHFVYIFCLINICSSLFDEANKIKSLNIER